MSKHAPRAGSLQFYPIKRSKRHFHSFNNLITLESGLSYFAGYKAGMLSVKYLDTYKNSPTYKQEIVEPATVIEAPPLVIAGVRFYKDKKSIGEIWADTPNIKYILRAHKFKPNNKKWEDYAGKYDDIRIIVSTQPWLIKLKKTPEVFELPLGGSLEEKEKYAKEKLGKEISATEIFRPGDFVDIAGVTKGKGFSGAMKRYKMRLFPWKAEKKRRRPGAYGTEGMSKTIYTIPQAGGLGYNKRTEYNKLILGVMNSLNKEFVHYGIPNSTVIIIKGSVTGPAKRLVVLRKSIRNKIKLTELPKILGYG